MCFFCCIMETSTCFAVGYSIKRSKLFQNDWFCCSSCFFFPLLVTVLTGIQCTNKMSTITLPKMKLEPKSKHFLRGRLFLVTPNCFSHVLIFFTLKPRVAGFPRCLIKCMFYWGLIINYFLRVTILYLPMQICNVKFFLYFFLCCFNVAYFAEYKYNTLLLKYQTIRTNAYELTS